MKSRGKLLYVASDLMDRIMHDESKSFSQNLRALLKMPAPKRAASKGRPSRYKFPVTDLKIGEIRIVKNGEFKTYNSVYQSVQRQQNASGKSFHIGWHKEGIQVKRLT